MFQVILYVIPDCPPCGKARNFFHDQNIVFQEKDIFSNEKFMVEILQKSGQFSVPVIDVNGKIMIDFDKGEVKKLLRCEKSWIERQEKKLLQESGRTLKI